MFKCILIQKNSYALWTLKGTCLTEKLTESRCLYEAVQEGITLQGKTQNTKRCAEEGNFLSKFPKL